MTMRYPVRRLIFLWIWHGKFGGGFGGCTVSIVKNEAVEDFKDQVGKGYQEKTGITPEFYVVDIGSGAGRLS